MPYLDLNGHEHYFESVGSGKPLLFVHGAFVDSDMWAPQIGYFSDGFRVIAYDVRGHGKTGPSTRPDYSIELLADDLAQLVDQLGLTAPIICGLSLGGMIAQAYAVREASDLAALILADTAVSVSLTLSDKLQRHVLFPKWMLHWTIRSMSVQGFTRFSFWLANATRSAEWFGRDAATRDYVYECMLAMQQPEYLKIYDAIYDFQLLPLAQIACPTLVLNGEHESSSVFRHTQEILRRVPRAEAEVVRGAGHSSNMENPAEFNRLLAEFLRRHTQPSSG